MFVNIGSVDYETHSICPAENTTSNTVFQGDNLKVLQCLLPEYEGKVKCIYIDPPYNTGATFFTYDDRKDSEEWLTFMEERLRVMWKLLTPDNGVLLISINDVECHYLKILCDRLFGRDKFVTSLIWMCGTPSGNQTPIINKHEYILVYSTTGTIDPTCVVDPNLPPESKVFRESVYNSAVKNGPKNPPVSIQLPAGFPATFTEGSILASKKGWPKYSNDVRVVDGLTIDPVTLTSGWSSRRILEKFIESGFQSVPDSKGTPTTFEITHTGTVMYRKPRDSSPSHVVSVLQNMGTTQKMFSMLKSMGLQFSFPKPLELMSYLIRVFTGPDDLVLDAFGGSGSTGHAVLSVNAQKGSSRRFILIEKDMKTVQGVLLPRLRNVINGHERSRTPEHGGGCQVFSFSD